MHMKKMLSYNDDQPGFEGHQWKSVLFCLALNLALYCQILNENFQRCRSDHQDKVQQQNSKFFGLILLKNINILNARNFGNTGPISKIPMLLSSEVWDIMKFHEFC